MPRTPSRKKQEKLLRSVHYRAELAKRHLTDGNIGTAAYVLGTICADTDPELAWESEINPVITRHTRLT